jgi:hypothetical protein
MKKENTAAKTAQKKTTPEIETKNIIFDLEACETPEHLAEYISTNFGEISLEAAELFFHLINK